MNPMSKTERSLYFYGLIVVFAITIPLLISNALGYRINNLFVLEKTGGIYVSTEKSGIDVYIDGVFEKRTNIFQRSFLIPSLKKGIHNIQVSKDGFSNWEKKVKVFEEKVTEIRPFIIPQNIALADLPPFIFPDGSPVMATSTKELALIKNKIENPEHVLAKNLFTATTSPTILPQVFASSTPKDSLIISGKMSAWKEKNEVKIMWLGDENNIPYYFCLDEICVKNITVPFSGDIKHFAFYTGANNLLLVSLLDGIYVAEIDNRISTQNIMPFILGENLDFRISNDGSIYIKKGDKISLADI